MKVKMTPDLLAGILTGLLLVFIALIGLRYVAWEVTAGLPAGLRTAPYRVQPLSADACALLPNHTNTHPQLLEQHSNPEPIHGQAATFNERVLRGGREERRRGNPLLVFLVGSFSSRPASILFANDKTTALAQPSHLPQAPLGGLVRLFKNDLVKQ